MFCYELFDKHADVLSGFRFAPKHLKDTGGQSVSRFASREARFHMSIKCTYVHMH